MSYSLLLFYSRRLLTLEYSFTPRGIVALVFSCICGILGVAVVAWYGFSAPVGSTSAGALSAGLVENDSGDVHSAQKGPQETVVSPTGDARSH